MGLVYGLAGLNMIHKRPYDGEDVYDVACKNPRHWESVGNFGPVVDIVPSNCGYPVSFSSGDDSSGRSQGDERLSDDTVKTANECEAGTSGRATKSCWVESDFVGCDLDALRGFDLSFFPEFFTPPDQREPVARVDESCSVDEYPSPKLGPEHQADVPDWRPRCDASNVADCSYEERLIGACVIPMPGLDLLSDNVCQRYDEHTVECDCLDHGSVNCIRQHIAEANEVLKRELGDNAFESLGFNDMGETVSKKWTEEEEALFREVVHTNPSRLGNNFLVQLSRILTTRPKKDLVSYYFNVFMLRKRMEQNRCVSLHIDSDDDRCQTLNEGHEDDLMLESLTSHGDAAAAAHHDAEAHEDDASASVQNETEPRFTHEYNDQNDSFMSSEIEKGERQP